MGDKVYDLDGTIYVQDDDKQGWHPAGNIHDGSIDLGDTPYIIEPSAVERLQGKISFTLSMTPQLGNAIRELSKRWTALWDRITGKRARAHVRRWRRY